MALADVAAKADIPLAAVQVTAKWEGCLKKIGPDLYAPYRCPANVETIGIGTTVYNEIGRKVTMSDRAISRARAEELLAFDLGKVYAPAVRRVAKFRTVPQYAACISFAYNVGTGGFKKSTLAWLINQGRYADAQREFMSWIRGGGRVLPGLINRRRDEAKLFGTPGPAYSATVRVPSAPAPSAPVPTQPTSWFNRLAFWRR